MDDPPASAASWRSDAGPRRWRTYVALLMLASAPFFLRGFLAITDPPVTSGFLFALLLLLIIGNLLILELPPYRFLHLATGIVMFAGFFITGPAILVLLLCSMKPGELLNRWMPRRPEPEPGPPLGSMPPEYIVPGAAVGLVLGCIDVLLRPIGLHYPFRPTDATAEIFLFLALAAIYASFILCCEVGVVLRFGLERAFGTRHARADLLAYLLGVFLGFPVVWAIIHAYGPDRAHTLFALGWMLWGFGLFTIAAILVRRGLRIVGLVRAVARQERLAALGRLASVIAHQTRHHLGILNMSAYVLGETLAKETLSPTARDAVARELEAIARTHDELDKLLARELKGGARAESFGLLALARECGSDLAPLASARAVTFSYGGEEQPIHGDRIRLKQAVTNVVRNAIEASPRGSDVAIAVQSAGAEICLTVRDRGAGLSAAAQKRLFEPLFTEKNEGLGMGLYVARAIVEAHGGRIALSSSGSGGAQAEIRLGRDA